MRKRHLLFKIGVFALIIFFIGIIILYAIFFDVKENEREEFPWFTFWVALMTAIGFTICCVVTVIAVKNKGR